MNNKENKAVNIEEYVEVNREVDVEDDGWKDE